jgi:SOS-response transcriptional repressor LexA
MLRVIKQLLKKGYPPTQEELRVELHYKSPNTVTYHLNRLVELGRVSFIPNRPRTINITDMGEMEIREATGRN